MALMKCKECGNEVSSKATACPKCGAPIEHDDEPVKRVGCGKIIGMTFLGFMVFGAIVAGLGEAGVGQHSESPQTPEQMAAKKKEDEAVQRAMIGAMTLKKTMRDPDSFKIDSALVIDVSGAVCYDYRARNGFGGFNVGHAVLAGNGKTFKSNEMDGFTRLWNKECANKRGTEVEAAANSMLGTP